MSGALGRSARATTAWRRRQSGTLKPTLQRTLRREHFLGMLSTQEDADQTGTPRGMRAAQLEGFFDQGAERKRVRVVPARVRSGDRLFPSKPDAPQ